MSCSPPLAGAETSWHLLLSATNVSTFRRGGVYCPHSPPVCVLAPWCLRLPLQHSPWTSWLGAAHRLPPPPPPAVALSVCSGTEAPGPWPPCWLDQQPGGWSESANLDCHLEQQPKKVANGPLLMKISLEYNKVLVKFRNVILDRYQGGPFSYLAFPTTEAIKDQQNCLKTAHYRQKLQKKWLFWCFWGLFNASFHIPKRSLEHDGQLFHLVGNPLFLLKNDPKRLNSWKNLPLCVNKVDNQIFRKWLFWLNFFFLNFGLQSQFCYNFW